MVRSPRFGIKAGLSFFPDCRLFPRNSSLFNGLYPASCLPSLTNRASRAVFVSRASNFLSPFCSFLSHCSSLPQPLPSSYLSLAFSFLLSFCVSPAPSSKPLIEWRALRQISFGLLSAEERSILLRFGRRSRFSMARLDHALDNRSSPTKEIPRMLSHHILPASHSFLPRTKILVCSPTLLFLARATEPTIVDKK